MASFRGHYEHTMDGKGRVSVPARYREVLDEMDSTGENADRLVVTHAIDGNLEAYPVDRWLEFEKKLKDLSSFRDEVKKVKRMYVGRAQECTLDSNGRILIPQSMREYAGLDRDVVWVGQIDRVELWDREDWQEASEAAQADPEAIQEAVTELGL
ncbi:MAG: division/cell wall cluster transcriptional repressor MraZ [Bradymonadaceae bacterium]